MWKHPQHSHLNVSNLNRSWSCLGSSRLHWESHANFGKRRRNGLEVSEDLFFGLPSHSPTVSHVPSFAASSSTYQFDFVSEVDVPLHCCKFESTNIDRTTVVAIVNYPDG
jgi:hypothetical protein